jgi:hypothetical protein
MARSAPYVREPCDRCRPQRQDAVGLHGSREHLLPGNDAVARDLLDAYLGEHEE